ncbi:hypothetical protein SERLA73DRAFT_167961 [Serpula lacrymans var. lacrymans S7.3]|uniref:Uncharacterized protein n=2 Tax=Serpula lacrymans var. lacrymans TaxID=341189 RepID=F8PVB6_SERL3|nr:uncharacterized protein SERLADRAFT_388052 [Serpula lacrymans var. lacrymans S7.9]EGO00126.1 hypothetical protein SERLA73DRAFT_167961 [Serpula lacrymans var. lacrymans S7.3]EGO25690.1 hypothetical protein SERLADRAFT_388052 [Serpula lacrymans var. lacrymans S7.9]
MSSFINPRSVNTYLSGIANKLEPHYPGIRTIRTHPLMVRTPQAVRCKKRFATDVLRLCG